MLAFLSVQPAEPLRAEESLIWTARTSGGMASLIYGSLDPKKTPVFLLTCLNEMDIAVLEIFGVVEGKEPGQKVTIAFAVGDKKASLEGKIERDDKSATMFAEASEVEPDPMLEVLAAPGEATVTLDQAKKTLSEQGRAAAVAQFSKDCAMVAR